MCLFHFPTALLDDLDKEGQKATISIHFVQQ